MGHSAHIVAQSADTRNHSANKASELALTMNHSADKTSGSVLISALLNIMMATMHFQEMIQNSQEACAETVSKMAEELQRINKDAGSQYSVLMVELKKFKPTSSSYGTDVAKFQSKLNILQAEFEIVKNNWNTPLQSDDQQLVSLGNSANQALEVR